MIKCGIFGGVAYFTDKTTWGTAITWMNDDVDVANKNEANLAGIQF